jgi:hypothetical protein
MDCPVVHRDNSSTVPIMDQTGLKEAQGIGTKWMGKKRNNIF